MNKNLLYKNAILEFKDRASLLDDVYDLLLRGALASKDEITLFSDIDITIIINKLSYDILYKIGKLNDDLSKKYPFKISITTITKEDYLSNLHHHGIKPLYYNTVLEHSKSLLGRKIPNHNKLKSYDYKLDCFNNVIYLVHELRKHVIEQVISDDIGVLKKLIIHFIKRSKHIIRNCIYILTEIIDENINDYIFNELFPSNNPRILNIIKDKANLLNASRLEIIEILTFSIIEIQKTFNFTLRYINELYNEKASN